MEEDNNKNPNPEEVISVQEKEPVSENKTGLYFYVIAIFVIVLVVSALIFLRNRGSAVSTQSSQSPTPLNEEESQGFLLGNNAIAISDYSKDSVAVSGLLEKAGFIVIHETDNGKPGAVIGYSELVEAGEFDSIEIELNRELIVGESLYAMLHTDNGDSEFELSKDVPVKDDQANSVMMIFKVENEGFDSSSTTPVINY